MGLPKEFQGLSSGVVSSVECVRIRRCFGCQRTSRVKGACGRQKTHFFEYLAASAAKYREEGWGRFKNWQGVIDKPILGLLTFGSNPDFSDFGVFCACFARVLRMFCACFAHVFGICWSQGRLR